MNGEWLVINSIQIVSTLNLSRSLGRYPLSPRFNALFRIASVR